ncbi:MAG: hypothetical protein AAGF97_13000 [Planctomycetota bacterium]
MRIKQQSISRMILTGIPGGRWGILALTLVGALLTAGAGGFAWLVYQQYAGLAWPHIPIGIGLLIAQFLFWTGAVTLAVGQLTLILDLASGQGEYRVISPIVDAGKPCRFELQHVQSVTVETSTESRPRSPGQFGEAHVVRARLRLNKPRRAITLDESENGRVAQITRLAEEVASFLDKPLEHHDK